MSINRSMTKTTSKLRELFRQPSTELRLTFNFKSLCLTEHAYPEPVEGLKCDGATNSLESNHFNQLILTSKIISFYFVALFLLTKINLSLANRLKIK